MNVKIILIAVLASLSIQHNLSPATYGSDTALSIVNPFAITGLTNDIKTFGCVKNGFKFADSTTTCSFYSIFPVGGPITLSGGNLWLNSDLILSNTGTLADLGTIKGQNHVVNISPYQSSFTSRTNASGIRVFELITRITASRTVRSVAWSYDNKYLAVITDNFSGSSANHELFVYAFSGTALTLATSANLGANGNCVRWHPSTYFLAVGSTKTSNELEVYQFLPATNTFNSPILKQNIGATVTSVAWQARGNFLAYGYGTRVGIVPFTASGSGTLGTPALSPVGTPLNGTVSRNAITWGPSGNRDDIIVGTSTGFLYGYGVPASGTILDTKISSSLGFGRINGLDWAPTGTYVAIAFNNSRVKTYQLAYSGATPSLTEKSSYTTPIAANTVAWKSNGTELAIGTAATASGNEFISLTFTPATYALSNPYTINIPSGINFLRYSRDATGTYLARADNTTNNVSIFKESYSPFVFDNTTIILNNNLTLGLPLTLKGNCLINGRGNTITFTGDGAINIDQGGSATLQQIMLDLQTPSAFALQGPTSKAIFRDATISLKNDVILGDGVMETYEDVTITGPYTFYLSSAQTSTIHSNSRLSIENRAQFKTGRRNFGGINPLEFEDSSSRLNLDDASLVVTHSGLTLKKGIINIYDSCNFDINLTETTTGLQQGLILGDGTAANDVTVKLHGNGASLTITSGTPQGSFIANASTPDTFKFYGQPKFSLSSTSSMYVPRRMTLTDAWFDIAGGNPLYLDPSAYLIGENLHYTNKQLQEDFVLTGTLKTSGSIILDNGDTINMNSGYIAQSVTVQRHNNVITGNGDIKGHLFLNDANSTLSMDLLTVFDNHNLTLNSGRLILENNLAFAHNYIIEGPGTVQMNGHELVFGNQDSVWTSTIYFDGDQSLMEFNANVDLTGKWTFSRDCVINGNGHELDLLNTGTIIIERGSTLTLRNMAIENLSSRNDIMGSDINSTLILDNCTIQLASGYKWKTGKLEIVNDVALMSSGNFDTVYTFSYESAATSELYERSTLLIYDGVNFEIGKKTATGAQPLAFEDNTGIIDLWGGSLTVTPSGMTLTKGTLRSFRLSTLDIKGRAAGTTLTLGDGTAVNDAKLQIGVGAASQLNVKNGKIAYNNYSPDNRIAFDHELGILNFLNNAGLVAYRNLNLQNGTLEFPGTTVMLEQQNGSAIAQTNMSHIHISPYSTHNVTASTLEPYTIPNGGSFLATDGVTETNLTFATGTGNFGGLGIFKGDLTLTGASTTVNVNLTQPLEGSITLNGGTVNLEQNFGFIGLNGFRGSGTITLNSNTFSLGNQDFTRTNTLYFDGDRSIIEFNANVGLTGKWTFSGDCTIDGNGFGLDLHNTGTIIIERGSTLTLKNINISNLARSNDIKGSDINSTLALDNCNLQLSSGYRWETGKIDIIGTNALLSNGGFDTVYTFSYASAATSDIDAGSSLEIYDGINFEIGKKTATGVQPLAFEDNTGIIDLLGGSLTITPSGMTITKGTIRTFRASTIDIKGRAIGTTLNLGDGTAANDAKLQIGVGAGNTLTVKNGKLFYNNYSPTGRIVFDNDRATIKFLNNAQLIAYSNLHLQNGTLDFPSMETFATLNGATLAQTNMTHKHGTPSSTHKITSSGITPVIIPNGGSVITSDGSLTEPLTFSTGTATLGGAGKISANITLADNATTIHASLTPKLEGSVFLNGGTFILEDDFGFSGANNFAGQGMVNLNSNKLTFGQVDAAMTTSLFIQSTAGLIELNSSFDMFSSVTFSGGICAINGRANVIDFSHGGMFTIRPNTTLVLNNVILQGLGNKRNNFCFMDQTSQLRLYNSFIGFDKSITTTNGGIYVAGTSILGLKGNTWTFDLKSSLTIDGVTLWKESLGASRCGGINFGAGDQSKYLTLLSTGTIKCATNGDLVLTTTRALGNRITTLEAGGNGITTHTSHITYASDTTLSQPELFKQGLTVAAGKTLSIDVILPVSGNINLSNSGTLKLDGDLILDSGAYLTSGGIIKGEGNTLLLTSSFVIPSNSRLKITSNMVIDGQGNNLVIGQGAKLIVDPSISVTIRNTNWFNSNSAPHLEMRADTSILTLDNVNMAFDRNFSFTQGRLFIDNDVMITGTNTFAYSSLKPLYIEPFATLRLDIGTTFSFSPNESGPHTASERDLLRLIDRTSQLYFDGCTINLPDAGMRLTRGTVCFDNNITINGNLSNYDAAHSLEFGDGISIDTDVEVKVLSGARVQLNGYMWHNAFRE